MTEWRCFHCDEVFTDPADARRHFGDYPLSSSACTMSDVSLLDQLRHAEALNTTLFRQKLGLERALQDIAEPHTLPTITDSGEMLRMKKVARDALNYSPT